MGMEKGMRKRRKFFACVDMLMFGLDWILHFWYACLDEIVMCILGWHL